MLFNEIALLLCLLLLFGTKTTAVLAARRGDKSQVRVFQFFRIGLSLSACSYLIRLMKAPPSSPYALLSVLFCFAGTLIIWIGWMEYGSLLRERAARRSGEGGDEGSVSEGALSDDAGLPRLNTQARQVLRRAQEEARGRRQGCVDTDHLLLGLLQEPSSVGVGILGCLNVQPEEIQLALGPSPVTGRRLPRPSPPAQTGATELLPLTDRALTALSLAAQEAHRFDKASVGTDHLLLGLVLMGTGAAASALFREGVTVEGVRSEVLKIRERR